MKTKLNTSNVGISRKQQMKNIFYGNFPLLGLIFVVIVLGIATEGNLFSSYNLKAMRSQVFLCMLGGLGVIYLFAQGGLDLSMASSISLACILGARVMMVNIPLGIVVTILVGVAVGTLMGFMYAYGGIPVFILGLSMNYLLSGLLWPLCDGMSSIPVSKTLTDLKSGTLEIVILAVVLLITILVYNYTKFGKECRAIGAGFVSAVQSGVNVARCKVIAFMISGLTCSVVALCTLIRTGSANVNSGANFNFNVMLSMILGGCVMGGGAGVRIRNAIIGVVLLIVLQSGLSILGVPARTQEIIKGILFIIMILLTNKLTKKVQK